MRGVAIFAHLFGKASEGAANYWHVLTKSSSSISTKKMTGRYTLQPFAGIDNFDNFDFMPSQRNFRIMGWPLPMEKDREG